MDGFSPGAKTDKLFQPFFCPSSLLWLPLSLPLTNHRPRLSACLCFFGHGPTTLVAQHHAPSHKRTLATVPCFPTVGSLVTSVFARQRHPGRWEHHRYEAQCGLELVTPSDSFAPKPHKKYLEGGIAKMFARACNAAQQGGVFAKVIVLEALPRCKCPVIMRQKNRG